VQLRIMFIMLNSLEIPVESKACVHLTASLPMVCPGCRLAGRIPSLLTR